MNSGQRYKLKTRDWLIKQGYTAKLVERLQVIHRGRHTIYQKDDLFGADVIGVTDTKTILANSVLGKTNVSKHIRAFQQYPSGGCKRIVVIWEKGKGEPEIRNVDDGVRAIKPKKLKK